MALLLKGFYQLPLLAWSHPAKNSILLRRVIEILVGLECCGVHPALRVLHPRLSGHLGHGEGVISRDDLHRHPLFGKIGKGLRRLGTDPVGEKGQGHGPDLPSVQGALSIGNSVIACQKKDPVALDRVGLHHLL